MSWNLLCPFCQARYKIEPEHQGTVCRCAKCGKDFSIPNDVQAWLGRMPDPPGSKRPDPEQRANPDEWQDDDPVERRSEPEQRGRNLMYCPDCGELISRSAVSCPICGTAAGGGKMPLKVSFLKKLFCGILMLVGAVFLIAGVICIVDPRYDTTPDSYEYLDSQGRIQTRELRRYRNEGNSHLGIGIVLSGFGLILIFGAGSYRRQR
jgi:hypothetical protein